MHWVHVRMLGKCLISNMFRNFLLESRRLFLFNVKASEDASSSIDTDELFTDLKEKVDILLKKMVSDLVFRFDFCCALRGLFVLQNLVLLFYSGMQLKTSQLL